MRILVKCCLPSLAVAALAGAAAAAFAAEFVRVEVDPGVRAQKFEGFGTSLGWFANVVGGWKEPARSDVVRLIFDKQRGLGFTAAKYYIGGGENPHCPLNHNGASHFAFSREMEGFKPTQHGPYDWTRERNQRWLLQHITREYGIRDLDANCLTAPWWMTVSGCVSGGKAPATPNLKDDYYAAYADYLVQVVKHFRDQWGIAFQTISPFAEASQKWWVAGHNQEGCFYTPEQMNRLLRLLGKRLAEEGLATRICSNDEWSVGEAVDLYRKFDSTARSYHGALSAHSYWGSLTDRYAFRDLALSEGKPGIMSESSERGGPHDHASMTGALEMAWHITTDVRDMGVGKWLWWEPVSDEALLIQYDGNWGAIHACYQGPRAEQYWVVRAFYGIAQYSRFIRPDDIIIYNSDPHVLTAYDPAAHKLVLAVYNAGQVSTGYLFDLSRFTACSSQCAAAYRTSAGQDVAQLPAIGIANGTFSDTVPAESITTYVVDGARYCGPIRRVINDNVIGKGENQFDYNRPWEYARQAAQPAKWCHVLEATDYYQGYDTGPYSKDSHWSGTAGDYYQVRFHGTQVKVYGFKDCYCGRASVSVDGGPETIVDGYATSKQCQALLFASPVLPKGPHIVRIGVVGTKNADATGCMVSADKVEVVDSESGAM